MKSPLKEVAYIGLGKMGNAMTSLLVEKGYKVHGFDLNEDAKICAVSRGVITHDSIEDMLNALQNTPKTVWIMVPARYVDDVLSNLTSLLAQGDTIIDGGNSFFKDSIARYEKLAELGINFIDCGTSGGVDGARTGGSLMVGGEKKIVEAHHALFKALSVQDGYAHVGDAGSGHFTKMVHNAIEYGMMGAIAEGINLLEEHKDGLHLNIKEALKPYNHGSIIESSLMDWLAKAYNAEGLLQQIAGEVPEGETEMEMEYLIAHENVKVLESAVLQRKQSRIEPSFTGTLISAMRNQFGGHKILKKFGDENRH